LPHPGRIPQRQTRTCPEARPLHPGLGRSASRLTQPPLEPIVPY
jgi:hypothetical protein